jgi:hypothetical protein
VVSVTVLSAPVALGTGMPFAVSFAVRTSFAAIRTGMPLAASFAVRVAFATLETGTPFAASFAVRVSFTALWTVLPFDVSFAIRVFRRAPDRSADRGSLGPRQSHRMLTAVVAAVPGCAPALTSPGARKADKRPHHGAASMLCCTFFLVRL